MVGHNKPKAENFFQPPEMLWIIRQLTTGSARFAQSRGMTATVQ